MDTVYSNMIGPFENKGSKCYLNNSFFMNTIKRLCIHNFIIIYLKSLIFKFQNELCCEKYAGCYVLVNYKSS